MAEPIRVNETRAMRYETVVKEWTYDDLLDLFSDDDGNLVAPLVRRCQQYEQEIADLKAKLESRQAATGWEADHQRRILLELGLADEFPFGCDAIKFVGEALLAAGCQGFPGGRFYFLAHFCAARKNPKILGKSVLRNLPA